MARLSWLVAFSVILGLLALLPVLPLASPRAAGSHDGIELQTQADGYGF